MLRKNYLRILMGSMAVMAAAFFVPMGVEAGENSSADEIEVVGLEDLTMTNSSYLLTANTDCKDPVTGKCKGHTVKSANGGPNHITITDSDHVLNLFGETRIDAQNTTSAAINIIGQSNVELHLLGSGNILTGGNERPGIYVDTEASLKITAAINSHELEVNGGPGGAAGIGGYNNISPKYANTGKITIESGKVTAKGTESGAGIGGYGAGTVNSVTICKEADVTATGGNNLEGAAGVGIGSGGSASSSGILYVEEGAKVKATGGQDKDGNQQNGIACQSIVSEETGGAFITTNGIADDVSCSSYRGILYNEDTNTFSVYGTTVWPNATPEMLKGATIDLKNSATLIFRNGATFLPRTLSDDKVIKSTIDGSGKIINPDKVSGLTNVSKNGAVAGYVEFTRDYIRILTDEYPYVKKGVDLSKSFYKVVPSSSYPIDSDGWSAHAYRRDDYIANGSKTTGLTSVTMDLPGDYVIVYQRKNYPDIPLIGSIRNKDEKPMSFDGIFTVTPREITDSAINIENLFTSHIYTGAAITPDPSVSFSSAYNGYTYSYGLNKNEDYKVSVLDGQDNINKGTVKAKIEGIGNFSGKIEGEFEIEPVDIGEAQISVVMKDDGADGRVNSEYSGKKKKVEVELTYGERNTPLESPADYTMEYEQGMKEAGPYTINIYASTDSNGNYNGNFTGTAKKEVTISKKKLSITNVSADYGEREYNGSDVIAVKSVNLGGVIEGDDVAVDPKSYGSIGHLSYPHVNESGYEYVTLDDVKLTGSQSSNYTASLGSSKQFPLEFPVKITKAKVGTPELIVVGEPELKGDRYTCTLALTESSRKEGVRYEYRISDISDRSTIASLAAAVADFFGGWDKREPKDEPVFDELIPGKKYTFEVRAQTDSDCEDYHGGNWDEGEKGVREVNLDPIDPGLPSTPEVKFELDDKTLLFKAIVEGKKVKDKTYEYCFGVDLNGDGIDEARTEWSKDNSQPGYEPETEHKGYIRFARSDDGVYSEGKELEFDISVPSRQVQTPVIKASTGIASQTGSITFVNETTVSITTETIGAKIYYTLDGSQPTEKSQLYKSPFKITGSTTVTAYAVRENMEDSATATQVFEGVTGLMDTTKLTVGITNQEIADRLGVEVGDTAEVTFKRVVSLGITKVPDSLKGIFSDESQIIADLSRALDEEGFENIEYKEYYDISVYYVFNGGKEDEEILVTADNFPEIAGGFPIKLPYPEKAGDSANEYDYLAAHMFSTDAEVPKDVKIAGEQEKDDSEESELKEVSAGDIEICQVEKLKKDKDIKEGITFTVNGTSPLAVAWKMLTGQDPNGGDDPANSSGNPNDGTGGDGNNGSQVNDTANNPADGGTVDGTGTDAGTGTEDDDSKKNTYGANASTDGSSGGGSGSGGSSGGNSSGNPVSSLASAIKTGDVAALMPWIIGLIASLGVIFGVVKKRRG